MVEESLLYLGIDEAVWLKTKNDNYYEVSFSVDLEDSDSVIQYFKSRNVGEKWPSTIGLGLLLLDSSLNIFLLISE